MEEHDLKSGMVDKIDPNHTLYQNVNKRYMDDKMGRQSGIPSNTRKASSISRIIPSQ